MIEQGIVTAAAPTAIQQNAIGRGMNHQVWVCHFGANIPCATKAESSHAPSAAMNDFCKTNATTDSIPAVATVYNWICKDGKALVEEQVLTVDPQKYAAEFWYELATP